MPAAGLVPFTKTAAGARLLSKVLSSIGKGFGKASKGIGRASRAAGVRIRNVKGPSLGSTLFNTAFSMMDPISAYDAYNDFKDGNIMGGVGNTLLTLAGIMTQGEAAKGLHRWFGLSKRGPLYLGMTALGNLGESVPKIGKHLGVYGWPLRHPIISGMGLTMGSSLLDSDPDPDAHRERMGPSEPLW